MNIGQLNTLTVTRLTPAGAYLGNNEGDEALLVKPNGELAVGHSLTVFVYRFGDGSLGASEQTPLAQCGEVAELTVSEVNDTGAFLDWGLDKQLLLPHGEQLGRVSAGKPVIVKLYLDQQQRIVASMRLDRHLEERVPALRPGQPVQLLVAKRTELGYKCVVNHRYWGLLYHSELEGSLQFGQRLEGWVKYRRPDRRLDVTLEAPRHQQIDDIAELILLKLEANDGFLALGDKSPPEAIKRLFGVSKKAFKTALSRLYKQRRIVITDQGIELPRPG